MPLPVAVILAAGVGRRLGPLTRDAPKALVDVGGTTPLGRSLDALARAGCAEALVVTGHRSDAIDAYLRRHDWSLEVRTRYNPDFEAHNNIVSFLVAADELEGGGCLLNSDIVFEPDILDDVASHDAGSWLVVDTDETLGAEEMKVVVDRDGRVRRVSKQLPAEDSLGEYIGIARFDAAGGRAVVAAARELVQAGRSDLYYEDAIDRAVAREEHPLDVGLIPTRGRAWTEIDDLEDHARAVRIVSALEAAHR